MPNTVYLSGPANNLLNQLDPQAVQSPDWKAFATNTFLKSGITVANPIELDISPFIRKGCGQDFSNVVKHSLTLIDRADSLLANIIQVSESTTMEIFYASQLGKQVVVVGNEPFSPWIMFHSEARFQKLKEAMDYLVSQPPSLDTITYSSQFESSLKRKSDQYPPEGEMDFEYYGGTLPALVIAPHATNYFKDGNLYSQESYTGALAVLLHKLSGCHTLISSYCTASDPVYYLNTPFVTFLSQLTKKISFKLALVLHGTEWNNQNELTITSWNKTSLVNKEEYLNLLTSMLKIKDFKEIGYDAPDVLRAPEKTLCHLLFEDLQIPTMRLEIHKRFRAPKLEPKLYSNLYTALAQFLMMVGF